MARTTQESAKDVTPARAAELERLEAKKAKAREAARKSMAKKRANRTPEQKEAVRLLQNRDSAKFRMSNRLDILVAEDQRRHSDPSKPKRRRVARLKRPHDYPCEDRDVHELLNKTKKADRNATNGTKSPKRAKHGSGDEEEEEDQLDGSDELSEEEGDA